MGKLAANSMPYFVAVITMSFVAVVVSWGSNFAQAEEAPATIKLTDRVPYGRKPVDYFGAELDDAVSGIAGQLKAGKTRLVADERSGYLLSVLELLNVPLESQILVYSKTARTPGLVSPKTPRAVFFNDEVSIAWIPEARELEITSVDPVKGINFYTLSQPLDDPKSEPPTNSESDAGVSPPVFQRRDRCLACHSGRSSLEIPGLLLRAFQTDRSGKPLVGFSRVTHNMNYDQRWGGWYVTDAPETLIHRGNLLSRSENERHRSEPGFASRLTDLTQKFDASDYPYPRSDLVAHLVFAHQVHGTNLLIRASLESRLNRRSDVEDELIRYLVFADEPPLNLTSSESSAVLKNSEFAAQFENRGPRDAKGNSLRQFSLVESVFRYRLSFLIYSRLFDELTVACRERLLCRLWHGLTSESREAAFAHLGQNERKAIVEIVRATVPRLPACWKEETASGT